MGPELMDGPDFGLQEVQDTFRMLVPVNRWFGGIRPQLAFFRRESRKWDRQRTYRILDVGCGAGDLAIALVRWARSAGFHIQVDGVDHHPLIVELARERCRDYPEISVAHGDVLELDGQEHDYVHASQFVHHFPNDQVVPLLRHLLDRGRCKLVVCDLVRQPVAYAATWLFTLGTSEVFRHDARLSVRRGFQMAQLETLLREGGLNGYRLERHFFYRFLLVMEKGRSTAAPLQEC
jgi:2-polyprenyl-3-methyl-5-hydroxy-6-metoxy-1,4-benzoquinol methylase